jgi:hypothetical protein
VCDPINPVDNPNPISYSRHTRDNIQAQFMSTDNNKYYFLLFNSVMLPQYGYTKRLQQKIGTINRKLFTMNPSLCPRTIPM